MTPLQEFIQAITSNGIVIINQTLIDATLKKERESIYAAFVAGDNREKGEVPFNAEQYFNQTFKQ